MATSRQEAINEAKVVSRAEWLAARKELLAKEKALTHARDAVAAERQKLPWVKMDKDYVFEGPSGKVSLASLFGKKSQLVIYHFMFGPDWKEGCPRCSLLMDNMDGSIQHLVQRDISFAAVSRGPIAQLEAFKKRMGWHFPWYSSAGTNFNLDFAVSFPKEDLADGAKHYNFGTIPAHGEENPGLSVFYKNAAGEIFHTYSMYGRGLEDFLSVYALIDRVPKGREESSLPRPMDWVRHHDRYEDGKLVGIAPPKA